MQMEIFSFVIPLTLQMLAQFKFVLHLYLLKLYEKKKIINIHNAIF